MSCVGEVHYIMFKLLPDKKICNPIVTLIHENNDYSMDIPTDVLQNVVDYIDSDISGVHIISNYSSLRGFNIPFNYFPYDFGISITSKKSFQDYVHNIRNKDFTLDYGVSRQFLDIVNGSLISFIYDVMFPYANKLAIDASSVHSNNLVTAMKKVLIPHIFNHVTIPHSIELIAERDPTTISEGGFYKDKVTLRFKFVDIYHNTFYDENWSFDDTNRSLLGWGVSRALLEQFSFFCENKLYINDMVDILHALGNLPVIYDTATVSIDINMDLNSIERYMLNMFVGFDIYYAEKAKQSERINKLIRCYTQDNYDIVDTEDLKQRDTFIEFINTLVMLSKYYVDTKELPSIDMEDNVILVNRNIACKLSRLCKMEYSDLLDNKELLYNLLKEINECK